MTFNFFNEQHVDRGDNDPMLVDDIMKELSTIRLCHDFTECGYSDHAYNLTYLTEDFGCPFLTMCCYQFITGDDLPEDRANDL